MARLVALLVALACLAGCKDGKDGETTAPPKTREQPETETAKDGPMTWERAEEIARTYYKDQGGGDLALERHPRVKYLFKFMHLTFLVHQGEVLEKGGGLEGLSDYLQTIEQGERKALLAQDLTQLVRYFRAYPPVEKGSPGGFFGSISDGSQNPPLRPSLEWSGDEGTFRIYYKVSKQPGNAANPDRGTVIDWTLTIAPDGSIRWDEGEVKPYDYGRKQFVE